MEYLWMVVVGLGVGMVMGQFLHGDNFGRRGDVAFGVMGALIFGVGLGAIDLTPDGGMGSRVVLAAIGAALALILRRVLKSV
jgi:uncharacterized membrane protein YeaQ/YmgE (transglycosylase-associated protein family)